MSRLLIIFGLAVPVAMLFGAYVPEWLATIGGVAFGAGGMFKLRAWIRARG